MAMQSMHYPTGLQHTGTLLQNTPKYHALSHLCLWIGGLGCVSHLPGCTCSRYIAVLKLGERKDLTSKCTPGSVCWRWSAASGSRLQGVRTSDFRSGQLLDRDIRKKVRNLGKRRLRSYAHDLQKDDTACLGFRMSDCLDD